MKFAQVIAIAAVMSASNVEEVSAVKLSNTHRLEAQELQQLEAEMEAFQKNLDKADFNWKYIKKIGERIGRVGRNLFNWFSR